ISKEERLNPIKQDVKNGKLRYVKNIFPHHGYIWNYGALPQTYEDPNYITPDTGCKGDSDPIDVCEIGHKIHARGAVVPVKVLGVLCLIDQAVLFPVSLRVKAVSPVKEKIKKKYVPDIEAHFPGLLRATYEWFKYYKVADGKSENRFAFNGEAKNREYTLHVIEETHNQWKSLINEAESSIVRKNTTVTASSDLIDRTEGERIIESAAAPGPAAEIDQEHNKWYYVIPQN
ncbi:unnamed protein product, partial [Candidula unifasciata]